MCGSSSGRRVLLVALVTFSTMGKTVAAQEHDAQLAPLPVPAAGSTENHQLENYWSSPHSLSDEEVGKRYVAPMAFPQAPPGVELLLESPEEDAAVGLSLDDLIALAKENNPTLRQAQMQVRGTLGKAIEAGLYPNPTFFYIAEQIFVEAPGRPNTPGEFQGAAVQQELVTADKREISRQKYLQRTQAAEWLAVAQQWRVCNDVRIHYWTTLGRRRIVEIRKELLKSEEDSALTMRERYQLGQATRAELHRSNVSLQQARLRLLEAENHYRQEFGILTSIVGLELVCQPLRGTLEGDVNRLVDFDEALCRIYSESPEILAAKAKWRADSITVNRERVEPIPNVFVRVSSGYNFESSEPVASAEVHFEVPIFDRNQGTIQQAEADLVRQGSEIRRTELKLRQELAKRYRDYLTALQHVMEYQTVILPEARAAYVDQLDAYKTDRQNWGDVLDAQHDYFDFQEQYVENLINWRMNETLIQGFLLHGGLEAAPSPAPPGHIDAVAQPR